MLPSLRGVHVLCAVLQGPRIILCSVALRVHGARGARNPRNAMASVSGGLLLPVLEPTQTELANQDGLHGAAAEQLCEDLMGHSSSHASSSSAPVSGVHLGRRRLRSKASCESPLSL